MKHVEPGNHFWTIMFFRFSVITNGFSVSRMGFPVSGKWVFRFFRFPETVFRFSFFRFTDLTKMGFRFPEWVSGFAVFAVSAWSPKWGFAGFRFTGKWVSKMGVSCFSIIYQMVSPVLTVCRVLLVKSPNNIF